MLFTEPVVFFFSLWVSFSWATLYLQFGSVPLVFKTNHYFNVEQAGAVFTCEPTAIHLKTHQLTFIQPCASASSSSP